VDSFDDGKFSPAAESKAKKSTDRHRWAQIKSKYKNICDNLGASVDLPEQAERLLMKITVTDEDWHHR
jgi:hypothetical protein